MTLLLYLPKKMFDVLKGSPLFKGLEITEIDALIKSRPFQIKQFSNQEVLAFGGESVNKAMILLEGKLEGKMVDFAGRGLKIEEIVPPQMVAAAFLYGPQSVFPVNLSALSAGKILILYKNEFTQLLSADQRVLNNYLNILSGKAQFLSQKLIFMSFKTIKEKIAWHLLQNLSSENHLVKMNVNQKNLALMFGVARPSLARTIGEMEAAQIIRWERNQVYILNIKLLQSILES